MSETLMIMSNPYHRRATRAERLAFPLPGVSVRLAESEGEEVADGETGEIYFEDRAFSPAIGTSGDERGFRGRLFPHGRPRGLVHPTATTRFADGKQRPDYFGRIQYLPARDRGIPDGAGRDRRGRGG